MKKYKEVWKRIVNRRYFTYGKILLMVKFLSLRIKEKKKRMKKRKKIMSVISELCMKIERDRKS